MLVFLAEIFMELISKNEVYRFLDRRNNRFFNLKGVEIICLDNSLYTYLSIHDHYENFIISIGTEEESIEEFIEGFKIEALPQIDHLEYKHLWMRYLNSYADMHITPHELEATLTFRLHKGRTMVFSQELHFFDEVNQHLTLPEDFFRYISDNERKLNVASNNRYKF